MPRQLDLYPQNLKVDHDPTKRLGMSADQVSNFFTDLPELILQALETSVNMILTEIDSLTGLNLVKWATLIENLLTGQGQSTSGDLLTDFTTWLTTVGNAAITALQNWVTTLDNLEQATVDDFTTFLADAKADSAAAWGQIEDFIHTGDWSDLKSAWQDFTEGIFGNSRKVPLLGGIPSSAVVKANQSLQPVWDFPNLLSINAGAGWVWDGTIDHTGEVGSGSARFTCTGVTGALEGIPAPVQTGQIVTPAAWVKWSGVTAASGTSPFQLQLVPYTGTLLNLVVGTPVVIGEVTTPAASSDWLELTDTYTVPDGVVAVQLVLAVTADAAAGQVWWDDCTSPVTQGGFIDDWIYALFGHRDAPTTTSQVLPGSVGDVTIGTVTDSIGNHIQSIVDAIAQAINGGDGTGNDPGSIIQNLQSIPQGNVAVTNAEALTTVSIVGSGAGSTNTGAGRVSTTWSDTIPDGADYVVVVVHVVSTSQRGATCQLNSINMTPLASQPYGPFGVSVIFFGLANPPTGGVTFTAKASDTLSVVTMIAGTSVALSGVGSVQDISYDSAGVDAAPSLSTSYTSPALALNAIGSFGTLNTDITLSGYNQDLLYHSGKINATTFEFDLMVGAVVSPSSPVFSASIATVGGAESFGAAAIALNPSSTVSVIGSGFRQYRTSTGTLSAAIGNNIFGTFFDTNEYNTEDCTYNSGTGVLTIGYTGHYSVTIHVTEASTGVAHFVRALLYRNGTLIRKGPTLNVTSRADDTYAVGATFNIYCQSGDTLQPGYWASRAVSNVFTGESTGADSYWDVSLNNRSLM